MLFLKLFKESILFALNALIVNKLRTFLSLLGISIGIFTIITVFTIIDSLERNVQQSVQKLGNDVIYVQKWPWAFGSDYPWWKYFNRPTASYKDYEQLLSRADESIVKSVCFQIDINNKVIKHNSNNVENATITCASHEFIEVRSMDFEKGRYFTVTESKAGRNVAIIGANIADALFSGLDPVGKEIKAMGRKIKVIGVVKKEGEDILNNSMDDVMLIPINFARNIVDARSERYNPMIVVKAQETANLDQLTNELKNKMRAIRRISPRNEDNFALNQSSILSNQTQALFGAIGIAGWFIGGFSILVGGFGIANIMFVSVKERTNVIGIQKSLGAKNYFILLQFLFEAIVLCIMGGLIGLFMVFIVTLLAGLAGFSLYMSFSNIFLGIGVSVIIGLISGYLPAQSAANLDPVEAIRAK